MMIIVVIAMFSHCSHVGCSLFPSSLAGGDQTPGGYDSHYVRENIAWLVSDEHIKWILYSRLVDVHIEWTLCSRLVSAVHTKWILYLWPERCTTVSTGLGSGTGEKVGQSDERCGVWSCI